MCSGCVANVSVPEVEEGYFEFYVIYEIDGVYQTYSGLYVCKFDGAYITLVGNGIKWDSYIEGTTDQYITTILETDTYRVYLDLGFDPSYFMDDPNYYGEQPRPSLLVEYNDTETGEIFFVRDELELYRNYGLRIIDYYYDEPIENSYYNRWVIGEFEPTIN